MTRTWRARSLVGLFILGLPLLVTFASSGQATAGVQFDCPPVHPTCCLFERFNGCLICLQQC
jgi:hypothetical protein